jgi:hypothetical protein
MSRVFTGTEKLTAAASPIASGAATIIAWVKPNTLGNSRNVAYLSDSGALANFIQIASMAAGTSRLHVANGANDVQVDAGNTGTGSWVLVAGRTNGTNSHKSNVGNTSTTNTGTSSPVSLVRTNVGEGFDGKIAHVAVWNTSLSDADIALLVGGDNPLTVQSGSLLAYWPLQDTGATESDAVGSNDLAVTGATHSTDDPPVDPVVTAPAAPSNLAAGTPTSSSIPLTWTDNANNETGFTLQYDTDPAFPSPVEIDIPTGDTQTDDVMSLAADTLYYFRVRAYNGSGASDWAENVGATQQYVSATTAAAAVTRHKKQRHVMVVSRSLYNAIRARNRRR